MNKKSTHINNFFYKVAVVAIVFVVSVTGAVPVSAADDFYSDSEIQFYDPNACDPNTGGSTEGGGEDSTEGDPGAGVAPEGGGAEGSDSSDESGVSADTLEGHKLPATKGGTGNEDPVNEAGNLTTTGESVTFGKFAKEGKDYRDYYITMRWAYAKWAWNGTASSIDNEEYSWFAKKARKIVVTNSRTNKSIIAVAIEAGPAPFAGAKGSQTANGYSSPQRYTPQNYTGRVSGLPPVAREAIGAKQTENGKGDTLYYAWAPDQDADPGPTNLRATGQGGTTGEESSEDEAVACCPSSGQDASGSLSGSTDTNKALNFFVSNGFSKEQAGGIVGNFIEESSVNPKRVEDGWGYPKEMDSVPPNKGPQGQPGFGIAQWTSPGRKTALKNFASEKNQKVSTLSLQLNFVMKEMNNYPDLEKNLKNIKGGNERKQVEDAALLFHRVYEGSADGPAQIQERVESGYQAIKNFTPSSGGGSAEGITETQTDNSVCSCSESQGAEPATSSTALQGVIKDLAGKNGNNTKIAVSLVDSNNTNDVGGETQMPTRSTYKIYTAYATLKAIEDGKISWSTDTGYGTVEKTMKDMIIDSSNEAAAALRIGKLQPKIGTPEKVTDLLQNTVGLSSKTIMGGGDAASAKGSNSQSTANDFVKFLKLLATKKLPGVKENDSYSKLLGYMKQAKSTNPGSSSARYGIVAGVGGDVETANKPGWGSDATNDVGIVYARGKTYAVAILTGKSNANNEASWSGVKKIAKGIHNAISGDASNSCSETSGDLSTIVKNYAWSEYRAPQYVQRKPAYASAVSKANSAGKFIGGSVAGVAGIDCGGFVTRVLQDSGFDENYNNTSAGKGNTTGGQLPYLKNSGKWKKINPSSAGDLQPGDVAINSSHTYLFVGDIDGFGSKIASASYSTNGNGRAPMAGRESPADSSYEWYRKK